MVTVLSVDRSQLDRKLARLKAGKALDSAAEDTVAWLRNYHVRFRLKWRGSNYMSGPHSGMFWQEVVRGWQNPRRTGGKITITNTFGLLAWKITGGTIAPMSAKALTIPLIPEAKGLRVAEFEAEEQTPLFRVGNALARRIGKKLQNVYALSTSVTQAPWPGALPPTEQIKEVFATNLKKHVGEDLAEP